MRRVVFITTAWSRGFHNWQDGNNGFEWKSRDLVERRGVAVDTLLNVGKRSLISDSMRDRCKKNSERLRESDPTHMPGVNGQESMADNELLHEIELLLSSEETADTMAFVPRSEHQLLREELYNVVDDAASLKSWMKLRRAQNDSFSSLPKEERNLWSAWYLRDVGPSDK
jgi:hypothetical protein